MPDEIQLPAETLDWLRSLAKVNKPAAVVLWDALRTGVLIDEPSSETQDWQEPRLSEVDEKRRDVLVVRQNSLF
jgi:hypothetical protein